MTDAADQAAAELFEATARMRELAATEVARSQEMLSMAEQAVGELLSQETLSAEAQAHLRGPLEALISTAQVHMAGLAEQIGVIGRAVSLVDVLSPDYTGVVEALAEALSSLALALRAEAAGMRLIHESQRRLGGDA
jgi:hypothetical protein